MFKSVALQGFLVFLFLILTAIPMSAKLVNRIVATVNGEIITLYELEQKIQESKMFLNRSGRYPEGRLDEEKMQREVLKGMVSDILLKQEAERLQVEVSEVELENYIEQVKQKNGFNQEQLLQNLQKSGMTLEEYKQKIREKIKVDRLLKSMVKHKVVVTQEEIKEFYEKHKGEYTKPEKYHLRVIVLGDKQKLARIREDILQGKLEFAQAAKIHSIGPGAEEGGDLGSVRYKDLAEVWQEALQGLDTGEISRIFNINENYALLFLQQKQEGGAKPLQTVRDSIRNEIYRDKLQEHYNEYIGKLRSRAVVEIRLGN